MSTGVFGCRSMTSLSSENFADGLKIDTTTSASESRSSMKVSIYYFAAGIFMKWCIFWMY